MRDSKMGRSGRVKDPKERLKKPPQSGKRPTKPEDYKDDDKSDDGWLAGNGGYDDIPFVGSDRTWRFKMDPGQEGIELTFLDGDGLFSKFKFFPFVEHDVKVDGWWNHWETCRMGKRGGANQCFLCTPEMRATEKVSRYACGAMTVIRNVYETKNGSILENVPMLYVCKSGALKMLGTHYKSLQKRGLPMVGARFEVWRTEKKSWRTGNQLQYIDHVVDPGWIIKQSKKGDEGFNAVMDAIAEKLKMDPDKVTPFDYKEELAWKSWDELEAAYGHILSGGKSKDSDDDDSPPDDSTQDGFDYEE